MGFLEAYKHLEKLCGEVMNDDRRIGAYIDEMQNNPRGAYYVRGWEEDLKRLKQYRWLRNQIVHNPEYTEENMCEPDDALWLDQFYTRIMEQADPLTLYRKATQPHPASVSRKQPSHPESEMPNNNAQSSGAGCLTGLVAALAIIVLVGILLL